MKKLTPIERAGKQIKDWGGIWTKDGWIVEGNLDLRSLFLSALPKIKSVGGNFDCGDNQLTNLTGSPKMVGGYFYCGRNQLTNLVGSPKSVGENFWCGRNPLKSLSGLPDKIGGYFVCDDGLSFPKEEIILLIKARPKNLKEIIKRIRWFQPT